MTNGVCNKLIQSIHNIQDYPIIKSKSIQSEQNS